MLLSTSYVMQDQTLSVHGWVDEDLLNGGEPVVRRRPVESHGDDAVDLV